MPCLQQVLTWVVRDHEGMSSTLELLAHNSLPPVPVPQTLDGPYFIDADGSDAGIFGRKDLPNVNKSLPNSCRRTATLTPHRRMRKQHRAALTLLSRGPSRGRAQAPTRTTGRGGARGTTRAGPCRLPSKTMQAGAFWNSEPAFLAKNAISSQGTQEK